MRNSIIQIGIVLSLAGLSIQPAHAYKVTLTYTIKLATQSPVRFSDHDKSNASGQPRRSASGKAKQGVDSPKPTSVVHNISPSPVYAPLPDFKKDVARKIKDAFPSDARNMIAIAMAESGLNCGAINKMDSNGVQAVGLFQINDGRMFSEQDIQNLKDCDHNIERAKMKYNSSGLRPWGVWHSGAFLRYLWIYDQI